MAIIVARRASQVVLARRDAGPQVVTVRPESQIVTVQRVTTQTVVASGPADPAASVAISQVRYVVEVTRAAQVAVTVSQSAPQVIILQGPSAPNITLPANEVFTANCTASEEIGDCVLVSDVKSGGLRTVRKMDPTVNLTKSAIGIIETKPTATTCAVRFDGFLAVSGPLDPGRRYFVGLDSKITATPPGLGGAGSVAYVQIMGEATDSGELFVDPQTPIKRVG